MIRSLITLATFVPQLNTGRRTLVATWDRELHNRRLRWAAADCMTTLRPHGPQLRSAPDNFITRRRSTKHRTHLAHRLTLHNPPATSTILLLRSATTVRIGKQSLFVPGESRLPSRQFRLLLGESRRSPGGSPPPPPRRSTPLSTAHSSSRCSRGRQGRRLVALWRDLTTRTVPSRPAWRPLCIGESWS